MLSSGLATTEGWRSVRQAGVLLFGACVLAACTTGTKAPVVDMSGAKPTDTAEAAAGGAATYVIRPGDTLYSIARAHNLSWQDLASWNNITDPSQLRVGHSLRVGAGQGGATASAAPGGTGAIARAEPISGSGVEQRPLDGATPAAPEPTTPQAANTSGIDWLWPASGKVISGYNAALNKGVDIEGTPGDPVVAAADGVVVYSGSGLRGYGNLLIVRHNASFLSAYAHNSKLIAKEGQNVRRGEKIAELGQTDAPSPRLHFEIRRGGTPDDPMKYLPQR